MAAAENNESKEISNIPMYTVTPRLLVAVLNSMLPKGLVPFIWGPMGIGKTDLIRQFATKYGHRVCALHLAHFDPSDLKGVPVRREDGTIAWTPSSYLPQQKKVHNRTKAARLEVDFRFVYAEDIAVVARDKAGKTVFRWNDSMHGPDLGDGIKVEVVDPTSKVILEFKDPTASADWTIYVTDKAVLFFDELSVAVPGVQNVALPILLDKLINEFEVPITCPIVAAGNRESDRAYVHKLSGPLANRCFHYRLVVNADEWIDWGYENKIRSDILGFINWKKESYLFKFNPVTLKDGDYGFCTPRMWAQLSVAIDDSLPAEVNNANIAGGIGCAVASEFIQFRKVMGELPDLDQVLTGRLRPEQIKDFDIGKKWACASALTEFMSKYHEKHYTAGGAAPAWTVACESFMNFADAKLGKEMTTMCMKVLSHQFGVSISKFKGAKNFEKFAESYAPIVSHSL